MIKMKKQISSFFGLSFHLILKANDDDDDEQDNKNNDEDDNDVIVA